MVDSLRCITWTAFGKHVSSMYHDLTQGRELGQLHIVINPAYFTDPVMFRKHITQVMNELNAVKPAPGFDKVHSQDKIA